MRKVSHLASFWEFLELRNGLLPVATCRKANPDAPATWPLVLPVILFGYENGSGWQHWSSQSLLAACLRN